MSKQKLQKILSTAAMILLLAAIVYVYIQKNYANKPDPAGSSAADISVEDTTQVPVRTTLPDETEPLTLTPGTEHSTEAPTTAAPIQPGLTVTEDGEYTDKDHVALYIHTYGKLPSNFITKKEAEALGWPGGSLKKYAPGKSIGGDRFGNNEGKLPKKKGRQYYECDIDYKGNSRGAKRIIYSNDGLIFYTDDHYETFTQLY